MSGEEKKANDSSHLIPDQSRDGVDLEHLRFNRSLTLEERVERNRKSVLSLTALYDAARLARYRRSRSNA